METTAEMWDRNGSKGVWKNGGRCDEDYIRDAGGQQGQWCQILRIKVISDKGQGNRWWLDDKACPAEM